MKKKIVVVSDIHGHYTLLKQALDEAGYDPENEEHLLVCCGDYFDRGRENYEVLKYMERLKYKVLLRGNHEDMLLEIFRDGYIQEHNVHNGTVETLQEFFGKYCIKDFGELDFSGNSRMLDRVEEFILGTGNYYETKNYVFTHGWLPTRDAYEGIKIEPNWRHASEERWEDARWDRWDEMYESCDRLSDKTIVCGHVPSFFAPKYDSTRVSGDAGIFYGRGVIVVDAGTFTSGKVNVLVIENEELL